MTNALADFNKAIELTPDFASGYFSRGSLKYRMGDKVGALADYDKAIALRLKRVSAAKNPRLAGVYNSRGNLERAKGDLSSASADFDEALEIKPDFVGAYINRGITKKAKGDLDGALADYNSALKIGSSGMFWEFFIGRDKGLIPRSGRRYRF
jgi:tetratricopeptide (TPR) repeat protein